MRTKIYCSRVDSEACLVRISETSTVAEPRDPHIRIARYSSLGEFKSHFVYVPTSLIFHSRVKIRTRDIPNTKENYHSFEHADFFPL